MGDSSSARPRTLARPAAAGLVSSHKPRTREPGVAREAALRHPCKLAAQASVPAESPRETLSRPRATIARSLDRRPISPACDTNAAASKPAEHRLTARPSPRRASPTRSDAVDSSCRRSDAAPVLNAESCGRECKQSPATALVRTSGRPRLSLPVAGRLPLAQRHTARPSALVRRQRPCRSRHATSAGRDGWSRL